MSTRSWFRRLFSRTPRMIRKSPARCRLEVEALEGRLAPSVSGGLIAFTSYRDGNAEIYVTNPDGTGQTNLTNNAGH